MWLCGVCRHYISFWKFFVAGNQRKTPEKWGKSILEWASENIQTNIVNGRDLAFAPVYTAQVSRAVYEPREIVAIWASLDVIAATAGGAKPYI